VVEVLAACLEVSAGEAGGVTVNAEVTFGLVTVEVHEVAAIDASTTTHVTVQARRADIDANNIFNDSPVSSFPALVKI
jgi:hypothetical protein